MVNYPVLVLNQNYEPLTICRARRALVLIYQGKAQMVEDGNGFARSANERLPLPSVIRLEHLIKRPRRRGHRLTRYEIFSRDGQRCQYCGKESRQLTLDHVMPRSRGGPYTWENIVAACTNCNRRKAGRTPQEASMKLLSIPGPPEPGPLFRLPRIHGETRPVWQKYLGNQAS